MAKVIFYPRYPSDYARDTTRLRLVHHGAYSILLDDYYVNGPLPADIGTLCHVCRAQSQEERAAVKWVAESFFPVNGDGLRHNKRADIEAKKIQARSALAQEKALKSWSPRSRRK